MNHDSLKDKKLFIAIPNSQHVVPSSFFWSFINMRPVCQVIVRRATHPLSAIRHNWLFKWFLESDCDYFLAMDVDQIYPPDYLQVMVPLIDEYKVLAPLIYDRWARNDYMPLAFDVADIDNFLASKMDITGKRGIIEVQYCHSQLFMAREVMEKLPSPPYPGGLSADGLQKIRHSDGFLNQNIRKAGYKIHLNLDMVVKHIAETPVDREFFEMWNQ